MRALALTSRRLLLSTSDYDDEIDDEHDQLTFCQYRRISLLTEAEEVSGKCKGAVNRCESIFMRVLFPS